MGLHFNLFLYPWSNIHEGVNFQLRVILDKYITYAFAFSDFLHAPRYHMAFVCIMN